MCFPLSAGLFMHTQLIYLHLNQANSEWEILFSLQKGIPWSTGIEIPGSNFTLCMGNWTLVIILTVTKLASTNIGTFLYKIYRKEISFKLYYKPN